MNYEPIRADHADTESEPREGTPLHEAGPDAAGANVVRRSGSWPVPTLLPSTEAAIALGAVLGASARFSVHTIAGSVAPVGLPIGTLIVNLVGCFLIGIMQTLFLDFIRVRREVQLFVSVGFLGGLTTFSSVSVETVHLIQSGALPTAAGYQALALVGGMIAAFLGIGLAQLGYRTLMRRRRR